MVKFRAPVTGQRWWGSSEPRAPVRGLHRKSQDLIAEPLLCPGQGTGEDRFLEGACQLVGEGRHKYPNREHWFRTAVAELRQCCDSLTVRAAGEALSAHGAHSLAPHLRTEGPSGLGPWGRGLALGSPRSAAGLADPGPVS